MKTVVISGASSGIGQAIVKVFSQKGWRTLMVARNQERLEKIKSEHQNTEYFLCDLSKKEQITSFAEKIKSENVDALINNAGIYIPINENEDHDKLWDNYYQTNLMSAVRLTSALWPQMKESKGSIVNISSTLGIRPIANTAAYSALKAAMNNWTLSLALQGAQDGIKANAICPGIIDTPIHSFHAKETAQQKALFAQAQKAQPLGRTGTPEDIAPMCFQLCQQESSWITGSILNIDGGILLNS